MADITTTATRTVEEIFSGVQPETRKVLEELFAELHPGLANLSTDIASIFSAQSAGEFLGQLMDLQELLTVDDSYDETVRKLQNRITEAESMFEAVLGKLFEQIRPIEASYRSLSMFFQNSQSPGVSRPVQLHVFNADPAKMKDADGTTALAIKETMAKRNDNFNFRSAICNLVLPGFLNQAVRDAMEKEAEHWGVLLISDLKDEKKYRDVERQFREKGDYEFLKRPEDQAAAHVVLVGWLRVREKHFFEDLSGDDGVYVAPSLAFAGAIARTDESVGMSQGPIGTRFGQIVGADKCRIEPRISQMEDLSMEKQVVPIIRDANNRLCFYGCRSLAEDPYGAYKFFTSYRIIRLIERQSKVKLQNIAGLTLKRDVVDKEIDAPLREMLEDLKRNETIRHFKLDIDRSDAKLSQGICDISVEVLPNGPAETFVLRLDVPRPKEEKK